MLYYKGISPILPLRPSLKVPSLRRGTFFQVLSLAHDIILRTCPLKGAIYLGLRFVFGRAGSGKSTLCLEEIRSELRIKPWGAPMILLVPEQATYHMEVTLANTPDLGGSLRAQVLSFR